MLDISRLEHVRFKGDKLIAACPACRAAGHDSRGDHLIIYRGEDGTHTNGLYGCVANEGDPIHRSEIFSLIGIKDDPNDTDKGAWAERTRLAARKAQQRKAEAAEHLWITQRIAQTLENRLAPYMTERWRVAFLDDCRINFDSPDRIPHDFILNLYQPDDILWLGDVLDSGGEQHRANFRTCAEWLELEELPPRIAPATFRSDAFSRSSINVKTSPFIVIESDDLVGHKPVTLDDRERNKALSHALTGYAQHELGLTLRAVIDTGHKSLHSWFDRPPPSEMDAIKKMAAGLRIDQSALDQGHSPFRMPGCTHNKTNQLARLLYLNPIHPIYP